MTPPTVRIAPSILSADFARLGEEVRAIEAAGAALVHFDVMDNHYVPNLTIGPLVCEAIRPHVQIPIDVHLMVEPVDALIPLFAKAGANIITFHPEASRHVDRTLQLIRDHGCKAGIVLNPATPLDWMDHVMDRLDIVLLMSVNPGFGGFRFFQLGQPVFLADGGINPEIRFATLAAWVWYQETRTPWAPEAAGEATPLLGVHEGTAFYLLYNGILGDRRPQGGNVLTGPLLATLDALAPHAGPRVVYGESCRLSPARLKALGIAFKQIPYDIRAR